MIYSHVYNGDVAIGVVIAYNFDYVGDVTRRNTWSTILPWVNKNILKSEYFLQPKIYFPLILFTSKQHNNLLYTRHFNFVRGKLGQGIGRICNIHIESGRWWTQRTQESDVFSPRDAIRWTAQRRENWRYLERQVTSHTQSMAVTVNRSSEWFSEKIRSDFLRRSHLYRCHVDLYLYSYFETKFITTAWL